MKKILVVSSNELFMESLRITCEDIFDFDSVICCDHKESLLQFTSQEPTHILICDYENGMAGIQTCKDISLITTGQRIVLCGFASSEDASYIKLPFLIKDLKEKLFN